MRIGIISDTHGRLHPRVPAIFEGVDAIVHAGDIGDPDILDALREIAPLTAVAGNIDGFACGDAGEEARATFDELRVYVTHILPRPHALDRRVTHALARQPADLVVFGHSHLPHDEHVDGIWYFNPASAGPRRFDYPVSVGMLEQRDGQWSGRHIALDPRSEDALKQHMNQLSRE